MGKSWTFTCAHCQTVFTKNYPPGPRDRYVNRFCTMACRNAYQTTTVTIACGHCGSPVEKTPCELRASKSGQVFCGHPCAARHANAHKTTGTRRSKLEVWMEERLRETYPDLDLHCNRTDAVNAELDFYFPSLRLAVELNGILHYEPIYGPEKLSRTQTNDGRKFQACLEQGIELCVIDTSGFLNFKPNGAEKFLTIIRDVVDSVVQQRLSLGWDVGSKEINQGRGPATEASPPTIVDPPFLASAVME